MTEGQLYWDCNTWNHLNCVQRKIECSPMVRETGVQSQVVSYQRLKKWYLITPCLTLSNIRYISRVKWSNPGKGVAPSPIPRCSCNWKGSLPVALNYGRQLYLLISIFIGYRCGFLKVHEEHIFIAFAIFLRFLNNMQLTNWLIKIWNTLLRCS